MSFVASMIGLPSKFDIYLTLAVAMGVVFITALITRLFPDLIFTEILSAIVGFFLVLVSLVLLVSFITAEFLLNSIVGPILEVIINVVLAVTVNLFISLMNAVVSPDIQLFWFEYNSVSFVEYAGLFYNLMLSVTGISGVDGTTTTIGGSIFGGLTGGIGGGDTTPDPDPVSPPADSWTR